MSVAGRSPYLGGVVVDAARAIGALEEGFVCNVLGRRFFGMNQEFLERYSASTWPSAPDRNQVNLGGGGDVQMLASPQLPIMTHTNVVQNVRSSRLR